MTTWNLLLQVGITNHALTSIVIASRTPERCTHAMFTSSPVAIMCELRRVFWVLVFGFLATCSDMFTGVYIVSACRIFHGFLISCDDEDKRIHNTKSTARNAFVFIV